MVADSWLRSMAAGIDVDASEPPITLDRVDLTDAAADLLRDLTAKHGPLMFHQSGGCCDGSSPMCFPDGDFITSPGADIRLGDLAVPGLDRAIPFSWDLDG